MVLRLRWCSGSFEGQSWSGTWPWYWTSWWTRFGTFWSRSEDLDTGIRRRDWSEWRCDSLRLGGLRWWSVSLRWFLHLCQHGATLWWNGKNSQISQPIFNNIFYNNLNLSADGLRKRGGRGELRGSTWGEKFQRKLLRAKESSMSNIRLLHLRLLGLRRRRWLRWFLRRSSLR